MIKEVVAIKKNVGNILWEDTIEREMENVKVTLPKGENAPNGKQYVLCLMIYDIEKEGLHRQAHLVMKGNTTHTLDVIAYLSVITRETGCIALTVAALQDLEMLT